MDKTGAFQHFEVLADRLTGYVCLPGQRRCGTLSMIAQLFENLPSPGISERVEYLIDGYRVRHC